MVTNLLEEQEHLLITCAFHYPTNVTWLKDGEPIDGQDSRIFFSKTERNSALAISHASYRDQGLYKATSFVNGKQIQTCQTHLLIIGNVIFTKSKSHLLSFVLRTSFATRIGFRRFYLQVWKLDDARVLVSA